MHIGAKIKEEVQRQHYSVTKLAKEIGLSRNVIYDIFERQSIDTDLLERISQALNHNFFELFIHEKPKYYPAINNEIISFDRNVISCILNVSEHILKKNKEFEIKEFEDGSFELNWNDHWISLIYHHNIETFNLIINAPKMHDTLIDALIQIKIFLIKYHKNLNKEDAIDFISLFLKINKLISQINSVPIFTKT